MLVCFEGFVLSNPDLHLMAVYCELLPVNVKIEKNVPLYLLLTLVLSGLRNLVDLGLFMWQWSLSNYSNDRSFSLFGGENDGILIPLLVRHVVRLLLFFSCGHGNHWDNVVSRLTLRETHRQTHGSNEMQRHERRKTDQGRLLCNSANIFIDSVRLKVRIKERQFFFSLAASV